MSGSGEFMTMHHIIGIETELNNTQMATFTETHEPYKFDGEMDIPSGYSQFIDLSKYWFRWQLMTIQELTIKVLWLHLINTSESSMYFNVIIMLHHNSKHMLLLILGVDRWQTVVGHLVTQMFPLSKIQTSYQSRAMQSKYFLQSDFCWTHRANTNWITLFDNILPSKHKTVSPSELTLMILFGNLISLWSLMHIMLIVDPTVKSRKTLTTAPPCMSWEFLALHMNQ